MLQELKARPLVLLLGGLLFGIGFPSISWLFGVVAVLCFMFRHTWLGLICIGSFAAGFLLQWHSPPPVVTSGEFHERIVLRSFPDFLKGDSLYRFETVAEPIRSGILKTSEGPPLAPFSVLEVDGFVNPGKNGNLHPSSVAVLSSVPLLDFLVRSQRNAIERTNELYGKEDGAWVTALTFNFPTDLSHDEKADLRFNGTYHLVSASGMHVWVLALLLHFLLVQAGVPRHWQLASVFTLLLAYCAFTGFHPATLRAALMWLIGSAAYLFRRSPDGLSALCLSALIWLAFVPSDAFNAGFQLSYIVSGCLLLWFERKQREESNEFRTSLEAAVVATVASEPLSAWWFGRIIFIGPISNLLIEFASSVVMVLGFLSLIPGVGQVCVFVAKPLIWWMKIATQFTAGFPSIQVRMHTLPPWLYATYYSLLLLLLLSRKASIGDPFKNEQAESRRFFQ
jgi:competence protein ComEC